MAPHGFNYLNDYNTSSRHQIHQQPRQQQQQHQSQNHSHFSNSAPNIGASSAQHQLPAQNDAFNSTYSTLSDRYTYNAQLDATYPTYNQQSSFNSSASHLTSDVQYRQQYSSSQTHPQYQSAQRQQNPSPLSRPGYGQLQTPAQRPSFNSPHPTPSASRSNHKPASQSQPHITTSPQWPQAHPTSFERDQPSVQANRNSYARQEPSDDLSYTAQQRNFGEHTTVDPSAVYDASHEYRRQVQIETARRAEESARLEEAARKAEELKKKEEARKAGEEARLDALATAARDTSAADINAARPTPPPKRKRTTKDPAPKGSDQLHAAATALGESANSNVDTSKVALEAQMREMFRKMREFNQQDPALLAQLWQQERDAHLAKESATAHEQAPQSHLQQTQPKAYAPSSKIQTPSRISPSQDPPARSRITPQSTASQVTANSSSLRAPSNPSLKLGFVWPAEKSTEVVATATQILKDANSDRTLPLAEIAAILDTNPSYLDFCSQIEAKGFKFDRAQLAKGLLAAAPDENNKIKNLVDGAKRFIDGGSLVGRLQIKARPQKLTKSKNESNGSSTTPAVPLDPQLEGLDAVKQFVDGTWVTQSQAQPQPQSKPQSQSQQSGGKQKDRKPHRTQPRILPPAPVTKHDLARKRTFQDLIDLTQQAESSDEESTALPKKREISLSTPHQLPTPAATAVGTSPPALITQPYSTPPLGTGPQSSPTAQASSAALPAPIAEISKDELQRPTVHQQQGPIPSQIVAPLLPVDHPSRLVTMIQPLDKYRALRRSEYNPKTIARDVLVACGRHPDMRHLNAHLEALKGVFPGVDNNSDLSTFRWDIADPGGPAPGSGAQITAVEAAFLDEVDADDEDSDGDSVLGGVGSTPAAMRRAIGANEEVDVLRRVSAPQIKKKPGRPPRNSEPGVRSRPGDGDGQERRPRLWEGGQSTRTASATPMGYQQLREQTEAESRARGEPVVKKKGRPVGWRKWMQKDGPAPTKPPTAKKPSPEPIFAVYKCEWKDCGAELHNLMTLRRHLVKLHCKTGSTGEYTCLWAGCGRVEATTDAATNRTTAAFVPEIFPGPEPWKKHVEKKHLTPIAWKLGDGPKGGLSDNYESEVSESYMSDSQGRRVTPRVVVAPPESASGGGAPKSRQTRDEREAEWEQRAEENRKRDIGPGLDRHGATLANSKRRLGFIDDEDIAEVVDEDD